MILVLETRRMAKTLTIVPLFAALIRAWVYSGERFLDAAFEMVDLGKVDDIILEGVVWFEELKASLDPPEIFLPFARACMRVWG